MNIERINPAGVHKPGGYSHVVSVTGGRLLAISGQVALDPAGKLVGQGDLGAQATQVFENLKGILASFGADLSNIVKLGIFIPNYDWEQRAILLEVRDRYFDPEHLPASTLLGVQALAYPELLIEVEAWAFVEEA